MKPLPMILIGVALLVLVGVWKLLDEPVDSGDAATIDAPERRIVASREDTPASAPASMPTAEVQPLDVARVDPVMPEVEANALPESYRKVLGGYVGRIVEENGEPVTDFPIALAAGGISTVPLALDSVLQGDLDLNPLLAQDITDSEGRFRLADVPTRVLGVLLLDPGGPRSGMHMLEHTPDSAREHDLGDIVLPGSVIYIGQVVDERKEPLEGVRVRATDLPSIAVASGVADFREGGGVLVDTQEEEIGMFTYRPPASLARFEKMLPVPTTYTDDEGFFELDGVRQGIVTVLIDDGIHMTQVGTPSPSGSPGTTRDLGELVMEDGQTLTGRVVDENDKPVPAAEVMAGNTMVMGPVTILRPPVIADAEGRFSVTGLAPRSAHAVARAPGADVFTPSAEVTPGDSEIRVVLPTPRTLTLEVVDPEGVAVPGVVFHGRSVPDDDVEDAPDFIFHPRPLDAKVTVDEFDRYVLTDLEPGLWDVIVKAPGYAVVREPYNLMFEDRVERIELVVGQQLAVRVQTMGEDPDPLEYAFVAVYEQDENDRPVSVRRTDESGRAVFDDLLEGDYRVEAEYPGLAIMQAPATIPAEEDVVVSLEVGGILTGTVVDNGEPPQESLMVTLSHEGDVAAGDQIPRMTLTAPDGTFAFYDVPAGDVGIQARQRIDLTNLTSWWEPFAMTPMAEAEAYVTAGQETDTVLVVGNVYDDIATGTVEGRVIVNGMPAAGWKVRTWGEIRRSVSTGPDGSFRMGRLAAGTVVLMFSPEGGGSMMSGGAVETHTFELVENSREFIDMTFSTGEVFGSVISDLDGRPVEGAAVVLEGTEGKGNSWWGGRRSVSVTQPDGSFELSPVAEGNYVVSVEADGLAKVRSEPFDVTSLRATRGIVVRLTPAMRFEGVVVFEDVERVPEWMWLTAEEEDGTEAAARPDPDDNRFVFDDLAPGTWTFSLYSDLGEELAPVVLRVARETDDAVLVFRPVDEDEDSATDAVLILDEG